MQYGKETARFRAESATDGPGRKPDLLGDRMVVEGGGPVCVPMYVLCACVYVCVYTSVHVCAYVYTCDCVRICVHVCLYVHMYVECFCVPV